MANKSNGEDEAGKGMTGKIKEILQAVPVYKDALQPGAKTMGKELKPAGENIGKAITTVTGRLECCPGAIEGSCLGI